MLNKNVFVKYQFPVKPDEIHMIQPFPPEVKLGHVAEIVCATPYSNPTVNIEWTKDGSVIQSDDRYYIHSLERSGEHGGKQTYSVLSFIATSDFVASSFHCFVDQSPYLQSAKTTLNGECWVRAANTRAVQTTAEFVLTVPCTNCFLSFNNGIP